MDPVLSAVVTDLGEIAHGQGVRVLLVGAWARDLCLGSAVATRATDDADFAVLIDSWERFDRFLDACGLHFRDIDPRELTMRHKITGLKVDIVPCGPIEAPPGLLTLRGDPRKLRLLGLAECFDLGTHLDIPVGDVLVPPPAGVVLAKLFSFLDRRARRDLRDLGHVLFSFPADLESILDDDLLMGHFAEGTLTMEDVGFWQLGRFLATEFPPAVSKSVVEGIDHLLGEGADVRVILVGGLAGLDPDERSRVADHALSVLRMGCAPGA